MEVSVCEGAHASSVPCVTQLARRARQTEDLQKDLGLKTFWKKMLCQCPVPCSEDAVGIRDWKMGCAGLSLCSLDALAG